MLASPASPHLKCSSSCTPAASLRPLSRLSVSLPNLPPPQAADPSVATDWTVCEPPAPPWHDFCVGTAATMSRTLGSTVSSLADRPTVPISSRVRIGFRLLPSPGISVWRVGHVWGVSRLSHRRPHWVPIRGPLSGQDPVLFAAKRGEATARCLARSATRCPALTPLTYGK